MNPSIPEQIARNRRYIRARSKPRIGILGQADGTLFHPEKGYYWARWRGSKDANGNATHGQPFAVWAGDTNYLPHAGRQVYIGRGLNGRLTVLGAVPTDLVNAGFDARAHNPNDAYRQYTYPNNNVLFRSDALADEGNDTLKVNLNQLLYEDAYGDYNLWNGTDANTHLDLAPFEALLTVDQHCLAVVALKTLENEPQTANSTPTSLFTPLTLADAQEAKSKLDPECIKSRVYRVFYDQQTLVASPVTDWDLRQWINVPARLGNPTVITERLRVRANHQMLYYGEVQILGELQVLGEVVLLGAGGGSSSGAPTTAKYLLQQADGALPNAQAMGALATGLVKNTTATGVQSIAAGSDVNTTFGSQTANHIYAAPNGSAGNPSFRAMAAADVPALPYDTDDFILRLINFSTMYVSPGAANIGATRVEYPATRVLSMSTNADWIGGTAAEGSSEFVWIYAGASDRLLYNFAPNCSTPAAPVFTAQINGSPGLNGTSIVYDNDTGEGNLTAGMLLGVYAESTITEGRGRGSGAAGSPNNISFALITTVDTGTKTITVETGHNINLTNNDYLIAVPFGEIIYREVSGAWYRLIGAIYNNSSDNLEDNRRDFRALYTLASSYTIASTTFAAIDSTNMAFMVMSTGTDINVFFSGSHTASASSTGIKYDLLVDGLSWAGGTGVQAGLPTGNTTTTFGYSVCLSNLLPGMHTITPQFAALAAGTAKILVNESLGGVSYDLNNQFIIERM